MTYCTKEESSEISTEHCILEPIGKTEGNTQTVYKIREHGIALGLLFHVHSTNTWQCCDGKDYKYPAEAIAGLIQLQKKSVTVAEKTIYTKAAAKRLIAFATKIEIVRELRNIIQVTYRVEGKKSSTFLSKKLFAVDFDQIRQQGAAEIEVVENHGDSYVVKSKDNYYTVRPNHWDPHQRCECGDCHHRGSKCKHQIAVEEFLSKELPQAA